MADTSHLERMGRELKCPICLSLLNDAVSLTCNHAFCNLCIMKSMKSGSNCPVCKVPYRRREVRPAPHMDNLVSIYKSMEVASGINIFVTQNAPPTKLSDEEKQDKGDRNHGEQETNKTCQEKPENQKTFRDEGSKKLSKTSLQSSGTSPVKPSFPAKKRVQLPQYPLPETPTQPAKLESKLGDTTSNDPKNSSISRYEKSATNERGVPVFSPFFWLREYDDGENSTQQTVDSDHVMDTPPIIPSFSDIRDSDDEMVPEMNPKDGLHIESHNVDYFDSEMFEWTQRACSPELCSTPSKMQVADTNEINGVKVNPIKAVSQSRNTSEESLSEHTNCGKLGQETCTADLGLSFMSSAGTQNRNAQISKKSNKRGKRTKKKLTKGDADKVCGSSVIPKKVSGIQEQTCKSNDGCSKLEKKGAKRTKTAGSDISAAEPAVGNIPSLSVGTKPLNQRDEIMVQKSPALLGNRQCSDKDHTMKDKIGIQEIKPQNQIDFSLRLKKRPGSAKDKALEEVYATETQRNQEMIHQLPIAKNKKSSTLAIQPKKRGREIKSASNLKSDPGLRSSKKLKVSFEDMPCMEATKDTRPVKKAQGNPEVKIQEDSSAGEKDLPFRTGVVLRKCETITNKIQCAFCHSTEDSEASGEMVHYFDGRPVAADHNEGTDVIHSHRNCTEWAPNVYFEDDTVKNLKAELARSRRITCGCCGIKGAALGCYEKSCRRSFHVPCAKLMPECRWDTETFVMLCPLHASSKLPSELPGSQGKQRKQRTPKVQQEQTSLKHDINPSRRWSSRGLPEKMVLCCSALSVEEKEIVGAFEKVSGVTELTKWSPKVTHVIASTDENRACRRTLKILMGILEGKWILSVDWIKACMKAMELVDEEQYEISVDIHGIRDGPRLGRLRLTNKEPKLFDRLKFYFAGDFIPSYKGYLHDLVIAAGGTVLHRKPVSGDQDALSSGSSPPSTFIIYCLELPDKCDTKKKNTILKHRQSDAKALASSTGAKVATNSWIMNSIAACKLQNIDQ